MTGIPNDMVADLRAVTAPLAEAEQQAPREPPSPAATEPAVRSRGARLGISRVMLFTSIGIAGAGWALAGAADLSVRPHVYPSNGSNRWDVDALYWIPATVVGATGGLLTLVSVPFMAVAGGLAHSAYGRVYPDRFRVPVLQIAAFSLWAVGAIHITQSSVAYFADGGGIWLPQAPASDTSPWRPHFRFGLAMLLQAQLLSIADTVVHLILADLGSQSARSGPEPSRRLVVAPWVSPRMNGMSAGVVAVF